jgi:hypothetical protein
MVTGLSLTAPAAGSRRCPTRRASGAAVAPGTGVGTLHVAGMAWQGGGRHDFEFSGATGDRVSGTGALDLSGLGTSSRFTINIASAGPPQPQTFTIATFAGGVSGFDPSEINFTGLFSGTPLITQGGTNLVLTFTPAPEPAHLLLLCAAAAGAARWCWSSRRRAGWWWRCCWARTKC